MKKFVLLKLCLLVSFSLFAQQYENSPDRPMIESVSVDPETGRVTIVWNMPDPQVSPINTEEFVLFWYEHHPIGAGNPSPTARPFATFTDMSSGPPYSFTFDYDDLAVSDPMMPDPRTTPVGFLVHAVNNNPYSHSLRAYEHYNMQVSNVYDSCRIEIRLRWHPYKGWLLNTPPNQPLVSYHVMRIPEGGSLPGDEIAAVMDTFYTIRSAQTNVNHTYYIMAKRADGVVSTSNRTTRYTNMPIKPSYIHIVGTQYNDLGQPEIRLKIDPAGETHGYLLSGTGNPGYAFVPIEDFIIYSDTTVTDTQNHDKTYYYKVEGLHICRGEPYVVSSNMATAIWLSIDQKGLVNTLRWDSYQKWDSNDIVYELYRKIGDNPEEKIATLSDWENTSVIDDLSGQGIEELVCYWLKATPTTANLPDEYANSNIFCLKPESEIYIPRAFIPKDTGQNTEYKPTFTFPPEEYLMILYDRTGAKVFETKNPDEGWNGQLMNRKPANEGVYAYYIRYRTAVGKPIVKKGTFVLLVK